MSHRTAGTEGLSWIVCVVCGCLFAGAWEAAAQASESLAARSAKASAKLTVALVPVDPEREWTKPMMTAAFEDALLKAGRFKVLSRTELETVMREQRMSASGVVDPASAVKLGKALAANYVLVVRQLSFDGKQSVGFGTALTGFGKKKTTYSMDLQAQVLDTETTELVQSQSFSRKIDLSVAIMSNQAMAEDPSVAGAYRGAVDEFAAGFTTNLAAALPLEALVVLARDPKNIALGVGQDVGIRPGAEMEIFEEGAPIKGPGGDVLGYDSRRVGRARVTRVEAKLTWVELVATFGADGNADAAPDFAKIKQYAVAKLAGKP